MVVCPYCQQPAKLVDSKVIYGTSYGNMWLCRPCDAYVGVHKNDGLNRPLGTLANAETRRWRGHAHAAFDPIWKDGKMKRGAAYGLLARLMELPEKEAHIAMFTVAQCKELIRRIEKERSRHAAGINSHQP